jgi:Na+:H+ antiporter, NhaA family
MALFFLLVGLEIKREMVEGQLDTRPRRALPLITAFGGGRQRAASRELARLGGSQRHRYRLCARCAVLVGSRVPGSLKVFLTSLAISDDLGAILIIATFYASDLSFIAWRSQR